MLQINDKQTINGSDIKLVTENIVENTNNNNREIKEKVENNINNNINHRDISRAQFLE